MRAIGVIDTIGYVSSVEALDVCLKTADVKLLSAEKVKGGIVSITLSGDVASVKSAVEAGVAAAQRLGGYRDHTIIANLDEQADKLFQPAVSKKAAPRKRSVQPLIKQERSDVDDPVDRQGPDIDPGDAGPAAPSS